MSEHGRIIAVTERPLGSTLVADTAAGATTLTVVDAAEFDDQDGGWLSINDQVIQYAKVDDDTGIITLTSGSSLSAAADDGDAVLVYDPLYQTIAVDKRADVVLDGPDDNTDAIDAGIALHLVDKIDTGVRGDAGESVILEEEAGDWKIIDVLGLGSSTATGLQFWDKDTFTVKAAGAQTFQLSREPVPGSVHMIWNGLDQPASESSIDGTTVTVTDTTGILQAGDVFDFKYAYRVGTTARVDVPYQSAGWKYLVVAEGDASDYSSPSFDDSAWAVGQAAFGYPIEVHPALGYPPANTSIGSANAGVWIRRELDVTGVGTINISARVDGDWSLYVDGALVTSAAGVGGEVGPFAVATSGNSVLLAVHVNDDALDPTGDVTYIDVKVEAA